MGIISYYYFILVKLNEKGMVCLNLKQLNSIGIIIYSFIFIWERSTSHPIFIPCYVRWPLVIVLFGFILVFFNSLYLLAIYLIGWSNDLQIESNEGRMTLRVQKTITNGFKIFLISEVMIFLSLIWAFIHLGLVPSIWLCGSFPP